MYRILITDKSSYTKKYIESIPEISTMMISILYAKSIEQATRIIELEKIDFFIFDLDFPINRLFNLIGRLSHDKKHKYSHVALTYSQDFMLDDLSPTSFVCDFIKKPLTSQNLRTVMELIKYDILCRFSDDYKPKRYLNLETKDSIYRLPACSIQFIESFDRQSYIYTNDFVLSLAKPLKSFIDLNSFPNLVKCHRCFIVNIENISYIDKKTTPWSVYFTGCDKLAYISRKYKQNVINALYSY